MDVCPKPDAATTFLATLGTRSAQLCKPLFVAPAGKGKPIVSTQYSAATHYKLQLDRMLSAGLVVLYYYCAGRAKNVDLALEMLSKYWRALAQNSSAY